MSNSSFKAVRISKYALFEDMYHADGFPIKHALWKIVSKHLLRTVDHRLIAGFILHKSLQQSAQSLYESIFPTYLLIVYRNLSVCAPK